MDSPSDEMVRPNEHGTIVADLAHTAPFIVDIQVVLSESNRMSSKRDAAYLRILLQCIHRPLPLACPGHPRQQRKSALAADVQC